MKKYLSKEQTEKLYSLGFAIPEYITEFWKGGCIERKVAYSIGDLIELLPEDIIINNEGADLEIDKDGARYDLSFNHKFSKYVMYTHDELIDNLFDLLVKLKEDKII